MISEATRTIEDSQTATALHGLLSLKADSGPSNFPALLKAVGQQMLPQNSAEVQVVQAADSNQVDNPEVPPAVATVVVASDTSQNTQTMNVPQGVAYKPKAGSVMDLLLQMQTQVQRNAANSSTSPAISATESLPVSSMTSLMGQGSAVTTSAGHHTINTSASAGTKVTPQQVHIQHHQQSQPQASRQLTITSPNVSGSAPVQMIPSVPRIQAQALTQLIQAQVPQQPVQCRPSQLTPTQQQQQPQQQQQQQQSFHTAVSSPISQPSLTTLYSGSKAVQAAGIPIQFITTPSGNQAAQILQTDKGGEIILTQIPQSGQPIILHPSLVMASTSSSTSTSTVGSLPRGATVVVRAPTNVTSSLEDPHQQSHNKSPLKKRPYPFTTSSVDSSSVTSSSSPSIIWSPTQQKSVKTESGQLYMQGGQLVHTAPGQVLAGAGDGHQPKTVTVLVQQMEGGQPQMTISPQLVDASVASTPNNIQIASSTVQGNNKHAEFTAIVAPIMKGEDETDASKLQQQQGNSLNMSSMAVSISEGFDDIFRYTRNQVEQMRIEEVARSQENGSGSQVSLL